uniref:DNA-directed DNA polymerase n=1 Tax=viral metagenome TaxID=1070528 RepID=A0A6C0BNW5_9ZZZZ
MKGSKPDISFRLLTLDLVDKAPPSRPTQNYVDQCTARMIGRTMDKQTVCAWVQGFYPYFFLQCPTDWHDYQVDELREYIHLNGRNMENNLVECTVQQSHRTFGFSDGQIFPFVKLSFRSVRSMSTCRHLFNNPIRLTPNDSPQLFRVCEFKGVPAVLKAIHDTKIQPSGWVKIPGDAYQVVRGESQTNLNIHTSLKSIVPFSSDDIPRFVEMSFDGEMCSENWVFPQATRPFDPITQLGVQFAYSGEEGAFYKVMFCLDEMGDLSDEGIEVRCHATEAALLMDFHQVIKEQDPDILTGYNIVRFDIPYILKRAKLLRLPKEFFVLGRFLNERTELRVSYKSRENQERKVTYDVPVMGGRRLEDCMNSVKNLQKKLTSYKLDYVANFYLGVGKHDVEAEDIFRAYQNTTDLMVAQHNQPLVQRMLTEVRIMKAFEHITRSMTENHRAADLIEMIASKWPREFHRQITACCREIFGNIKCPDVIAVDDATQLLEQYVELRRRGTTLIFGNSMMDLSERWLTQGISVDNLDGLAGSPAVTLGQKRTRHEVVEEVGVDQTTEQSYDVMADIEGMTRDQGFYMEVLKKWERRIEAEQEILQVVIQQRTTRKFAEKWYVLRQEIQSGLTREGQPISEERQAFAQTYFNEQVGKQRAWHLAEKTRVARYCMQDAALPIRLRKHHQFLISLMEMSQVTWVPCNMLLEKGQTIKVINLIVLWARENNYVVTVESIPEVHFKGGCVLVPKKNFYKERVFTLDFASLYPSLIQSHKLCYLSFVMPEDVEKGTYKDRDDLEIAEIDIGAPSNTKYQWVTNKRTLLPEMLEELVNRRRMVKKALAKADDPQMQIILNQRQLALKLVCNSTYGFTGYKFSPWPCQPIAVCTTLEGRKAIAVTKKMAEDHFNANVVYGDTDSIMAIVPIPHHLITDLEKMKYVFDVAQEAAAFITKECFTAPMKLEFEKVYYPYLLVSKKRYSGQKFTKPEKSDGIDTKGIEAIRRDNCPLLRNTVIGALNILGYKMDVALAIKYARRAFIKLANQSATWEELTISKSLAESYKSDSQIHVQVARYLEENHPLLAPDVGDRVPFVVIKKPNETRGTKAYEKGYNPILAEREGHEPDWFHYAFKCLKKPLDRIFCIALGLEYKKGKECQPTDQLWEPYLKRICDNDKIQHARVSGNTNLDSFFKKPKVELFPEDEDTSPAKMPAKPATVPKKAVKNSDIRALFKK